MQMKTMRELIESTGIVPDAEEPTEPKPLMHTCADYAIGPTITQDAAWRRRWLGACVETQHPELLTMFLAVERVLKGWLCSDAATPRRLILAGRIGTGKSTLARRMIRAFAVMAPTAYWEGHLQWQGWMATSLEWARLANLGPADRGESSCWVDAEEADPLLLDDIGTEVDRYRSGLPLENLRLMLEHRRNRRTILTTNVLPENWEAAWDARIADRLRRDSLIVELRQALKLYAQNQIG